MIKTIFWLSKILKKSMIKALVIPVTILLTLLFNLVNPLMKFPALFSLSASKAQSSEKVEANQFLQQGIEKLNQGQVSEAQKYLQQALKIYRQIK
ncbi:MAG: hypothetical protein ACKPEQ_11655, partial [Dolichospermum sp.]